MAGTIADVMVSEPKGTFPRYSLMLSDEPAGNPIDHNWKGAFLRFNGIGLEELTTILRRVAERLDAGETLWTISRP